MHSLSLSALAGAAAAAAVDAARQSAWSVRGILLANRSGRPCSAKVKEGTIPHHAAPYHTTSHDATPHHTTPHHMIPHGFLLKHHTLQPMLEKAFHPQESTQ
jgi:hypothetical protein